jgi:tripartite ATP-independent transporter DctM subunit
MANLSIARLFFASAMPGILLSVLYLIYIIVACNIKPEWGPVLPKEERNVPIGRLLTMLATSLVPPMFLILAVLGVIFFGIAAPTEAAGTGAVGGLILLAAYGHFNWKNVKGAFLDALPTVSMVMFVILGAKFFTITFLNLGGADVIRRFLLVFNLGPTGLLFLMLFLAFIMGMFMDFIGIMFIITPIYAPLITSFGFNPLWFGMLFCLTLVVSLSTPPFAYAIFYLKGIAPPEMDLLDMYKGIVPFVILQIITVVLVWFFPDIVLWLPGIMFEG